MTSWQRRARLGVLLFGAIVATVVYFGLRERRPLASYGEAPRLEPKAVSECQEGSLQQVTGAREDAVLTYSRCVTYEDGSTKLFDVRVTTKNRDGRVFTVSAKEGRVTGKTGNGYALAGGVLLRDSTGFELATDSCQLEGTLVRAAGPVTFTKGRMSGGGVGMSYEQSTDVLHIDDNARVDVNGDDGSSIHSTAKSATLDRQQDLLTLDGNVHAIRGSQVTSADHATAHLSMDEDVITFVELRGQAQVEGETGSVRSMRARDIDLDYTENGAVLERALLVGEAAIALSGKERTPGRGVTAEKLDIVLAADGSVDKLVGETHVSMSLPAASDAPARSISSERLDGSGGSGGSLTSTRFSDKVVFREGMDGPGKTRVVRARLLTLEMMDETISSALFTGAATFEEDDLRASAAEARYEPKAGRLLLSGSEAGALPAVADRRLRVDAQTIEIGLERRTLDARGKVKTFLSPAGPSGATSGSQSASQSRLPGLFAQDQGANVTSARLVHEGEGGIAHYSGGVWLWQGEREIRAENVDINQTSGDLTAMGAARSTLVFESGRWDGRSDEIAYTDAMRMITYSSRAQKPNAATNSRLKGPQVDLAGKRIEVILDSRENRVDRIEAYGDVTTLVDGKTITGQRLTYRAQEDRYEVVGTPAVPITLRESCREMVGNTLTFDRSTDTMTIDGRNTRTETKNPCRAPASSR